VRARLACLTIVLLCGLVGCRAELVQGVDEREANAIVLALDEAGIGAWKERSAGAYRIEVSGSDVAPALHVLETRGLPHQPQASLESSFGEGSLIATPDEERARLMSALSGELSRTLGGMPGVVDARVHLALPARPASLDAPPQAPTASILLRVRPGAAIDEASTRELVAHAVESLALSDIHIAQVEVDEEARETNLDTVGPFAVARGSSAPLKFTLAILLLTNLVLAASVGWFARRARR
jgi:type III secretion protein J